MRHKIYIAGSLFTEAEIAQRLHEGQALAEVVGEENVFNPITNPFNDKRTLPEALHIFLGDYKVIRDEASIFLVNLDNPLDAGVMVELGQILQMKESGHDIEVIGVLSDIRVDTAGEYDGLKVPWGYNQYVIGALEYYDTRIFKSFNGALEYIKEVHGGKY